MSKILIVEDDKAIADEKYKEALENFDSYTWDKDFETLYTEEK
mgnify:CR=1 FL=1